MKKKKRVPKSELRVVHDFFDHAENLYESLSLFHQGKRRATKSLLHALRTLITKDGILRKLNDRYSLDLTASIREVKETVFTKKIIEFKTVLPLEEYLNSTAYTYYEKEYSHADFIWELASQDSVHEDSGLSEGLALGESVALEGMNMNLRTLGCIARVISATCRDAEQKLREKIQQGEIAKK